MAAKDPRNPDPGRQSQTGGGYQPAQPFGAPGLEQGGGDSESEINVGLHLFEGAEHFQSFITELKTANEHLRALGQSRTFTDEIKAHKETQQQQPSYDTSAEIRDILKQISSQISVFGADATSTPGQHPGATSGVSGSASSAQDINDQAAREDLGRYANPKDATIPVSGLRGYAQKFRAVGTGLVKGFQHGERDYGEGSTWAQGEFDEEGKQISAGGGPITSTDEQGGHTRRGHKAPRLTGAIAGASQAWLLRSSPPVGQMTDYDDDKNEEGGGGGREVRWQAPPRKWGSLPEWEIGSREGQEQEGWLRGEAKRKPKDTQRFHYTASTSSPPGGGGTGGAGGGGQPIRVVESSSRLDAIVAALHGQGGASRGAGPISPGPRGMALPHEGAILDRHGRPIAGDQKAGKQPEEGGDASNAGKKDPTGDETRRFSADHKQPFVTPRAGEWTGQNILQMIGQGFERFAHGREAKGQDAPIARSGAGLARQAAATQPYVSAARQYGHKIHQAFEEHVRGPTQLGALEGADPMSGGAVGGFALPFNSALGRGIGEKANTWWRAMTTPGLTTGQAAENKEALQGQGLMGGGAWGDFTNQMRNSMDWLSSTTGGTLDPKTSAAQMTPMVRYGSATAPQAAQEVKRAWDIAPSIGQNPQQLQQEISQYSQQQQSRGATSFQGNQAGSQLAAGTGFLPSQLSGIQQNSLYSGHMMQQGFLPQLQGQASGGTQGKAAVQTVQDLLKMYSHMPGSTERTPYGDIQHSGQEQAAGMTASATNTPVDVVNQIAQHGPQMKQDLDIETVFGQLTHPTAGSTIRPGAQDAAVRARFGPTGNQEVKKMHDAGAAAAHDAATGATHKTPDSWLGSITPGAVGGPKVGNFVSKLFGGAGGGETKLNQEDPVTHKPLDPKVADTQAQQKYIEGRFGPEFDPIKNQGKPPQGGGGGAAQQIDLTDAAKKYFQMVPNPNNTNSADARAGQGNTNSSFGSGRSADVGGIGSGGSQ